MDKVDGTPQTTFNRFSRWLAKRQQLRAVAARCKLEEQIAEHRAKIKFWEGLTLVKDGLPQGTLPGSVCGELANLYGALAVLEVKLKTATGTAQHD